jgi:pimeloyl-ACP methyl ester carboxylesterase
MSNHHPKRPHDLVHEAPAQLEGMNPGAWIARQPTSLDPWAECKKRGFQMKIVLAVWALISLLLAGPVATAQPAKPTIVLVHGAFADSSSWYGVIAILEKDGYSVLAAANPLRSVKGDADTVRALLASINTPIVLVGHSYGGMVISNAANGQANVKSNSR